METETIDKLFLELSQITKAKSKRELELEAVIKGALEISNLWLPKGSVKTEHIEEAKALRAMYMEFVNITGWVNAG